MTLAPDLDPGPDALLRDAVVRRVTADPDVAADPADRPTLRRAVARALAAEGVVLPPARWARLVRDLVDDLAGLGPLEALLRDPEVTDVCCNAPDEVWVDRAGVLQRAPVSFDDDAHVRRVLARVLGPLGVRLDPGHPWADAVLPSGVRLHALLPPLADHPTVTLRRVPAVVPTWDDWLAAGALDAAGVAVLRDAVAARRNLVVCGPAGAGKTTLLARLLAEVRGDRVVVIQDAPELAHPAPHSVHLRVRPASPDGAGGVDTATLVRNALRMRPDRIVLGEVRGAEVADLLQAMNTGHHGSATTVHANSAADARTRLVGMALLAGMPVAAAEAQVATAVDVVVSLSRQGGRRRVDAVLERDPAGTGTRQVWP
ncbi:MAG: CpaF family protein [Actinomycetes bacterium]